MGMKTKDREHVRQKVEGLDIMGRISEPDQVGELHLLQGEVWQDAVPVAPAYYVGRQKGTHGMDDFDLYNLTEEIPGYVQGSTVSGRTLMAAGFRLPPCVPIHDHERVLANHGLRCTPAL